MTAGTTKFRCSCGVGKRVAVASTDITIQTKPTKPNLHNLPNQTYQTKLTKPKLLVKAVNTWVRSAFGNVFNLFNSLSNLIVPCLCFLYNAKCAKMPPVHLGLGEL